MPEKEELPKALIQQVVKINNINTINKEFDKFSILTKISEEKEEFLENY